MKKNEIISVFAEAIKIVEEHANDGTWEKTLLRNGTYPYSYFTGDPMGSPRKGSSTPVEYYGVKYYVHIQVYHGDAVTMEKTGNIEYCVAVEPETKRGWWNFEPMPIAVRGKLSGDWYVPYPDFANNPQGFNTLTKYMASAIRAVCGNDAKITAVGPETTRAYSALFVNYKFAKRAWRHSRATMYLNKVVGPLEHKAGEKKRAEQVWRSFDEERIDSGLYTPMAKVGF